MNSIIDRLFACKNAKYSPDGKQNYIELGIEKVEKLFLDKYTFIDKEDFLKPSKRALMFYIVTNVNFSYSESM